MNLLETLRSDLVRLLPIQAKDSYALSEITTMPMWNLVTVYLNWRYRQIYPRSRRVYKSDVMLGSSEYRKENIRCRQIFAKIASGQNVHAYLSRSARIAYLSNATRRKDRRRPDLDLLLNEWGIHHLHLSPADPDKGFPKDDSLVMFVVFRSNSAYALTILPHGEWYNEDLVAIAVRNWPKHGLFSPLQGMPENQAAKVIDRRWTRKNRVNAFVHVDGRYYMAVCGGLSSNGISSSAMVQYMSLQRSLKYFEEHTENFSAELKREAARIGARWPLRPHYRCTIVDNGEHFGFGIIEDKSKSVIGISGL